MKTKTSTNQLSGSVNSIIMVCLVLFSVCSTASALDGSFPIATGSSSTSAASDGTNYLVGIETPPDQVSIVSGNVKLSNLTSANFPWGNLADGKLKRWPVEQSLIPVKLNGSTEAKNALDLIEATLGKTIFDRTSIATTPDINGNITRGLIVSLGTSGVIGVTPDSSTCGVVSAAPNIGAYPPSFFDSNGSINTKLYVNLGSSACVVTDDIATHEFGHALGLGPHFDGFGLNSIIDGNFWNALKTLYYNPIGATSSTIYVYTGVVAGNNTSGSSFPFAITNSGNSIGAQLFAGDGTKIGSVIPTGHYGISTSLAFDGTNYLLTWLDDSSGYLNGNGSWQIYGQFVNKAGAAVGLPFPVSSTGVSNAEDRPVTSSFGGGKYLVTYTKLIDPKKGSVSSNRQIYGHIVDANGPTGSEFQISTGFGNASEVAFDGTNFFVVWREDSTAAEIRGRFVSPAGVPLNEIPVIANISPGNIFKAVAFDGSNYMVAWFDKVDSKPHGRVVSPNGTLVGNQITISNTTGQVVTSLSFDGTNYLAVLVDMRVSTNWDMYGQYISTSGALGSNIPINIATGNQLGVGFFANGKYLALVNNGVVKSSDKVIRQLSDSSGVFIIPSTSLAPKLRVTIVGDGNVNSDIGSPGIHGSIAGTVESTYAWFDVVNLTSLSSAGSTFSGWSGACAGNSSNCKLIVDWPLNDVTATFIAQPNIRSSINTNNFYGTVQSAFNSAVNGDNLLFKANTFIESPVFNKPGVTIKMKGGYIDSNFTDNSSITTVSGELSIKNGLVRIENVRIKP